MEDLTNQSAVVVVLNNGSGNFKWHLHRVAIHPLKSGSNWNLETLVFEERGKLEKNLPEQRREPTTNSSHIWHLVRESIPSHIGGRRVVSPVHHPCSLSCILLGKFYIIAVTKDLQLLVKKLNIKYRSLAKYQMAVKIVEGLITGGYVDRQSSDGQINYIPRKRENIFIKEKSEKLKVNNIFTKTKAQRKPSPTGERREDTDLVATDLESLFCSISDCL